MSFLEEFKKRGYFYQCTDEENLEFAMSKGKIVAYVGFDCTAKSLHVGNLMQIMILRLLQQHGHKPIILVGGATTKIGDPTGKDEVRKYLSDEDIAENMNGIKRSLEKFIKFGDGPSDAIMVNNADWLDSLGYIEFLRNMGRMFSVNRMLSMDSVRLRLEREQSLTFLEFNYSLLQAYDFYYLNKKYNCQMQLGGSDQWGNIITGVDLIHKAHNSEEGGGNSDLDLSKDKARKKVFGLTTPLLTTASGVKMGKSLGGAIWINETELSAYDYYQYWRNTEDADVVKFAKLYCEFNDEELAQFEDVAKSNINEAKKRLAHKVTALCHGIDKADNAMETAIRVFEQGGLGDDLPSIEINLGLLRSGISCVDLFIQAGLSSSKGESRRLIRGKGARVNDNQVSDESMIINDEYLVDNVIKLSSGKKKHVLVKVSANSTQK